MNKKKQAYVEELERYKEAVRVAREALDQIATSQIASRETIVEYANEKIKQADAILNPPPVFEDVTVERWECDVCGRVRQTDTCNDLCLCHMTGNDPQKWTFTKLTGTRRVQVAQKVERSVSVAARINLIGDVDGVLFLRSP